MFVQPSPCPSHSIQLYTYIIPTSLWSLKHHAVYDAAIPISICIKLFTSLSPNSWPFRSIIQSPLPCHVVCDPGVPISVFIQPSHWMHCLSVHMYAYTCTHTPYSFQPASNDVVTQQWYFPGGIFALKIPWQCWPDTICQSDCSKDRVNAGQTHSAHQTASKIRSTLAKISPLDWPKYQSNHNEPIRIPQRSGSTLAKQNQPVRLTQISGQPQSAHQIASTIRSILVKYNQSDCLRDQINSG